MATAHCFRDDALGRLDAVGVAAAIRVGEIGREEVAEAAIARVRLVDPTCARSRSSVLAGRGRNP